MINWVDISSRRTPGTTFQAKAGEFLLTVTRHIHYSPGDWLCSVQGLLTPRVLGRGDCPLAAQAALEDALRRHLVRALSDLGEGRQV